MSGFRYFVCAVANKSDTQRFYNELGKRLAMFNLQNAYDKTHTIRFSLFLHSGKYSF
jgi:hypothetical protein